MEKTIAAVTAAVAIAAATAVSVVAAAFALYAVLLPRLGPAGASAALALVFAILAFIGGALAFRKADGGHHAHHAHEAAPTDNLIVKVIELAKDKPLLAAGAALAAGVFVIRNPAVLTAVISAFVAGNNAPPPKR